MLNLADSSFISNLKFKNNKDDQLHIKKPI